MGFLVHSYRGWSGCVHVKVIGYYVKNGWEIELQVNSAIALPTRKFLLNYFSIKIIPKFLLWW